MLKKIDHIGVIVKDFQNATKKYNSILNLPISETLETKFLGETLQIAFLPLGESSIELITPDSGGGALGEFLQKHGEGIHHIAIEVDDINQIEGELKSQGIEFLWGGIIDSERGVRVLFIKPDEFNGVLVELIEIIKD